MLVATLSDIKNQCHLTDNTIVYYSVTMDGTITLRRVNEYELLAEDGLKSVYDDEPDGLWEKCLDD